MEKIKRLSSSRKDNLDFLPPSLSKNSYCVGGLFCVYITVGVVCLKSPPSFSQMETNVRQAASSSSTSTSQQNTHEETSTLAGSPPAYSHIIDFAPLPPTHSIQIIDSEFLVQQVTSVGISEEWARIALRRCSGNVDDAIRLCIDCGALENETPPTQSATSSRTGKKKGNILSRTLGKPFKRSAEKSERTVIQEEKIERDLPPELPPSYDVVVPAPPPTELSIEDEPPDLPSYEEIFSEPSAASPQKVSTEIDSNESKLPPANHLPVPPPPRVSANSMTSPEESALDYSTCEVSSNAENSSVPQTSLPDTQPSFSSAPPLLSQSQKSWRGWKHSDSSGEISPVYAPVSRDFTVDCSVDLTVTDMRKIDQSQSDDQHVDEDLDSPPEYEENVVLTEISQHTPRLESGHSAEETVRSSEDNEASESEPIPLISNTRSTSGPIVLTFDDVVSSDDESVQTEEISPDPYLHGRSSLRMQSSLETLIDRGEESPVQVTSRLELTSDINIPGEIPPTSTIRQDVSDFTQITSPRSHVPENLVVEAVTPSDSSPTEIPQSRTSDTLPHEDDTRPRGRFQTRSNSHAYTLPTHLPSHSTGITSSLPPRPTSISRLPRATAVIDDDNMDDDTIHGEAYVQVSMSSVGVGTAVADLYMRDESGGLYMAVAAPLTGVEDDDLPTPFQAPPTIGEGDQPRGMFSYARNRLYGQQRNTRRDIAGGVRRRVFLPFDIEERDGKFFPVLYLTQPKLGANNGPQYNRPAMLRMTPSSSRTLSVRHAEVNTPPLWDGGSDPKECSICLHTAGILYKIHHCRNCGHYVCNNCSKKDWLASMLPKTYVPEKESVIRVCDNCSYLQEGFVDALRAGDLNRSMVFYLTGNVNVHCPMTIYKSEEYPIHTAVQGGNIHLVRWLVEDRRCSLRDGDAEPLKTSEGLSPLAIAAFYGHRDIMEYLVREQGSHVTEIKDTSILLRGLHAALEVCLRLHSQ